MEIPFSEPGYEVRQSEGPVFFKEPAPASLRACSTRRFAAEAGRGMSAAQTLVVPALFTAGMALVNTGESALMTGAYGWAFVNPIRKLCYNLTITAASVVVAVFIGSVEVSVDHPQIELGRRVLEGSQRPQR